MNRILQKLGALGIAGLLMAGTALPAFASDTNITADITINGKGSAYAAYRLMDLKTGLKAGHEDHAGTDHTDDCYAYAYSVNETYAAALRTALGLDAAATNDDILAAIEALSAPEAVREFADAVFLQIKDMTADKTDTNKVFADMPQGYYLIVETGDTIEGDARSLVMLDTAGQADITVDSKEDVPTLTKQIKDTNDTTGETSEWQDAGDFDIGDDIEFKLTGTLPKNIANFSAYKYIFHDTLSAGLSFKADSVEVMAGTTKLAASEFTVTSTSTEDNCSFEVAINDVIGLLNAGKLAADSEITVTYKATLTDAAKFGAEGNDNTAHLEFSRDPYNTDDTTKTPDDRVVGFTFKLKVDKTDSDNNPLQGAEFKLQKFVNGEWTDYKTLDIQPTDTTFNFQGLDSGKYKLIETKVPSGYNKADDIEFEVVADYTKTSTSGNGTDLTLTSLVVKNKDGVVISEGDDAAFAAEMTPGQLSTIVVNSSGIKLPSTGDRGAYLVYGLGAVGVIGAGLAGVMYSKRKKNNAQ